MKLCRAVLYQRVPCIAWQCALLPLAVKKIIFFHNTEMLDTVEIRTFGCHFYPTALE